MPAPGVRPFSQDDVEFFADLERRGAAQVRQMLSGQWPRGAVPAINEWLSDKDEKERIRNEASRAASEASHTSQAPTARSENMAVWIAAIATAIIAITAIVSIYVAHQEAPHPTSIASPEMMSLLGDPLREH
jgi:hypothetical protein